MVQMKRTVRRALMLLVPMLLLGAGRVSAQHTPEHMAAAMDLMQAMNVEQTLAASIETVLHSQIQNHPDFRQFEGTMRAFFTRYMSWESLRDRYAAIYADAFTEAELREMAAFYRTPVGQKLSRATPDLMARGGALGEEAVRAHLPELQEMIMRQVQTSSGAKP
jgi:uncharacterized protein